MMFSWGFAFLMPLLFLAVTMMLLTWGLADLHAVCLRFSPRVRDLLAKLEQQSGVIPPFAKILVGRC
jgi:hypothetical protein